METIENEEHKSIIRTYWDGDKGIMWITLENVFSWFDEEYTHKIELAWTPKFIVDLMDSLQLAWNSWKYNVEVLPQILQEVGDLSFTERPLFL